MSAAPPAMPPRLPHVSQATQRRYRRIMALLQRLHPGLASRVALTVFLRPVRRPLDPQDAHTLSRARREDLCFEGGTLATYEWGTGPRLVVLVHGWGSHAPRFAPLVDALVATNHRVVAFDAPAHGESAGRRSSLPQFQRALLAVLVRHGPADLLIGHSLGALAVALCLGNGQVTPAPRGAVLISMPSGAPFLIDRYREMFGIGAATTERFLQRFARRFGHAPAWFEATRVIASLSMPLLFVHDEADDVVPADHARRLAAAALQARIHLSRGLGHSALLRDPGTIHVITDFAKETGNA